MFLLSVHKKRCHTLSHSAKKYHKLDLILRYNAAQLYLSTFVCFHSSNILIFTSGNPGAENNLFGGCIGGRGRWRRPEEMPRGEGSRVFVGNITTRTNERDFERFFDKYGRVRNIFVRPGRYGFCVSLSWNSYLTTFIKSMYFWTFLYPPQKHSPDTLVI